MVNPEETRSLLLLELPRRAPPDLICQCLILTSFPFISSSSCQTCSAGLYDSNKLLPARGLCHRLMPVCFLLSGTPLGTLPPPPLLLLPKSRHPHLLDQNTASRELDQDPPAGQCTRPRRDADHEFVPPSERQALVFRGRDAMRVGKCVPSISASTPRQTPVARVPLPDKCTVSVPRFR